MIGAAAKFGACDGVNVMCLHSTALAAVLMSHNVYLFLAPRLWLAWRRRPRCICLSVCGYSMFTAFAWLFHAAVGPSGGVLTIQLAGGLTSLSIYLVLPRDGGEGSQSSGVKVSRQTRGGGAVELSSDLGDVIYCSGFYYCRRG